MTSTKNNRERQGSQIAMSVSKLAMMIFRTPAWDSPSRRAISIMDMPAKCSSRHSSRINEIYDAYAASSIATLTLDSAGMTEDYGVVSYVWDEAGRLSQVKQGLSTLGAYAYDAQNLRTEKTVGAATTYYVHGRGGKLYGAYDGSGNVLAEYVYMGSRPLAQIEAGEPEVLTYLHVDHLGTPREGSDASGSSVWSWAYAHNAHGEDQTTGMAQVQFMLKTRPTPRVITQLRHCSLPMGPMRTSSALTTGFMLRPQEKFFMGAIPAMMS
jgi:YD repeat-containing protein